MKELLKGKYLSLATTILVLVVLFGGASMKYDGFFSARVVANLFSDNAFLGIAAIGMTFVILSGGIDLSVGAVIGFTTILMATLVMDHQWHPLSAMALSLAVGTGFGYGMGYLIQRYELPPFLVTLGGLFLARGMAFVVSAESVGISGDFYDAILDKVIPVGPKALLSMTAVVFVLVLVVAMVLAHFTRFGRTVYAIGGSESSARLMGLNVDGTKRLVYAMNGFCSALAGIVATFYMSSGNPTLGVGLELDAIASVVIGGTLLSGGVGYVFGTLIGVLIFGTIQTVLVFDGTLSSSWLRIAIGGLLLLFILLQKLIAKGSQTT
ncbi:sugar ABC transporter permease YjfF [Verrucomicrobia bacterium]|nr:sugar ABC transporter permease YjfF [Verrucomicrobiota bacterium]